MLFIKSFLHYKSIKLQILAQLIVRNAFYRSIKSRLNKIKVENHKG